MLIKLNQINDGEFDDDDDIYLLQCENGDQIDD